MSSDGDGHVWTPPAEVLAAGERASVRYGAPWAMGAGEQAAPSPALVTLAGILLHRLRGVPEVGMRRPASRTAEASRFDPHRCGIAADVMVAADADRAARGDAIANALVTHAEALGVQYVLWSGREWSSSRSGPRWERYTGTNPHRDHVHFELGPDARAWSPDVMRQRAEGALFPSATPGVVVALAPWLLGLALVAVGGAL